MARGAHRNDRSMACCDERHGRHRVRLSLDYPLWRCLPAAAFTGGCQALARELGRRRAQSDRSMETSSALRAWCTTSVQPSTPFLHLCICSARQNDNSTVLQPCTSRPLLLLLCCCQFYLLPLLLLCAALRQAMLPPNSTLSKSALLTSSLPFLPPSFFSL